LYLSLILSRAPSQPLFPYTTLFRSEFAAKGNESFDGVDSIQTRKGTYLYKKGMVEMSQAGVKADESSESSVRATTSGAYKLPDRSEEHTSELQSRFDLVCRLLLEKK